MVNVVSRSKASSHPSPMGGIYVGIVKTVAADGRVFVSIPKLGNTIGPLRVANSNTNSPLLIDEQVLCAFTSMSNDEMYVLGYVNSRDIFTPYLTTPSIGQILSYNGTEWVNTGTPAAGTTSTGTTGFGYMGLPQNSATTGAYGIVAADAGKHIYSTASRVITIPANATIAMPVGATIVFVAGSGATVTIAITSDTMYLAGPGTTGSRTLAPFGMATAIKITSTSWKISGNGLT